VYKALSSLLEQLSLQIPCSEYEFIISYVSDESVDGSRFRDESFSESDSNSLKFWVT